MKTSSLFITLLLLASCASMRPERPAENYADEKIELQASLINIPLDVNLADLEKLLNKQIKGLIYEDTSLDDNNQDNMMVKAWKKEDIRLSMQDNVLSYKVPLKLWIKVGWKVSRFGLSLSDYREVNAEIALKFRSALTATPDWTISTSTTSEGYEWLSTPVIKAGPVNIPITFIADLILKANQKTINREIDKAFGKNLDIKQYIGDIWVNIQKPVKVNNEYNIWLKVVPQDIYSTPISSKAGKIRHTIGIKAITEAFVGREPDYKPVKNVPKLSITSQVGDDFLINLVGDITYSNANELARQYLKGHTFREGKYALLINDIDVFGSDGSLIIHLNVSGSLKGDLYFKGKPMYNPALAAIQMENLDFELKTKNALAKSGSWLFHSTLVKMLQKNMVFPLKDQLTAARSMIEENVKEYQLAEGIVLKGSVDDLSVGQLLLTKESIKAMILLKGKINVSVK